VFDMDGTLTKPLLDFDAIREEIGLPEGRPILEAMESLTGAERRRAEDILLRREREAAHASELNDGAAELLARLRRLGLPAGLLTRNCRECVEITSARHGLSFARVVAREDAPAKPAPDGLLLCAADFGVAPAAMLMVGDYLFDLQAGRAAGSATALLTHGRDWPFAPLADHLLESLHAAIPLVERLAGPPPAR
jgi:HAD superfamily hydrolase (TIGR01509 family)